MTATADPRPARAGAYPLLPGCGDEAFGDDGTPRPAYRELLEHLQAGPPARIAAAVREESRRRGVEYRTDDDEPFLPLDPVPRLLSAEEHSTLAAGLAQRTEALDAFARDAYGARRIVAAGKVPERVITESPLYEPLMQGIEPPADTAIHVAGPDLVRDAGGELLVLEDNLRSPSGLAYALEARRMLAAVLPIERLRPLAVEDSVALLREALWRVAPAGRDEPRVVLLSDGPASAGWFEHRWLARKLEIPAVAPEDLEVSKGRVWTRATARVAPVDVIYRRTEEERLSRDDGGLTELGELLAEPVRSGTVAVANAFGTGVADDKLAHAYVEAMIRFYLGQDPVLRSVATLDLADPESRELTLDGLGRMVVKGRGGLGGAEVEILSEAGPERLRRAAAEIRRRPEDFVAQGLAHLSTHPTIAGDRLEPRRIDLRPFVVHAADGYTLLPASLTRYAPDSDALHVNSSLGGGCKDTWVVDPV